MGLAINAQNPQLTNVLAALQTINKIGVLGGSQQYQQQNAAVQGPASGAQGPLYSISAPGAAEPGQPLVINPMPNRTGRDHSGLSLVHLGA